MIRWRAIAQFVRQHLLKNKLEVGAVPVFSMDGLKHYFYALTAHFGEWVHVEGQKKLIWMIMALS
ncbi:hypothetical protein JZU71_03935, partial [bacterium]|nr:hypothetical protein [bacterium]